MITKEAIEAGARGVYYAAEVIKEHDDVDGLDWEVDWGDVKGSYPATHEHCVEVATAVLTAALAAMPAQVARADRLRAILRELWAARDIDLTMCDGSVKTGQFGMLRDLREDLGHLLSAPHTPAPSLAAENERLAAEVEELKRGEATDWQPISTCPLKEAVDLWCVYGCEEYARYDGGASIGQLVVNRFKHEQYGFFGNQSNDGVPRGHAKDLVPVAWRPAVKQCPAELIAAVLGIPLTLEDAKAALEERT